MLSLYLWGCRAPKELPTLLAEIDNGAFRGWADDEPGEEQPLFLTTCAVERKQMELQRASSAAAASHLHGDSAVSSYWTDVQADLQKQIEALWEGMDLESVERGEHLLPKESSQPAVAACSSRGSLHAEGSPRKGKGGAAARPGLAPSPPATQKSSVSAGARSAAGSPSGARSRAASVGARSCGGRSAGGGRSRRVSSSEEEDDSEEESSSEEEESEDDEDD